VSSALLAPGGQGDYAAVAYLFKRVNMNIVPPIRIDFSADDKAWIAEKITEVLTSGRLTLGVYGDEFEKQFAAMHGVKHAIAVNSGTCSLEIIFRSLNVQGKDVLVPADTFAATAVTVIAAGGNPILMDTDLRTLSTTVAEIEKRLTPNASHCGIVQSARRASGGRCSTCALFNA
jgi:perosamine synthetase